MARKSPELPVRRLPRRSRDDHSLHVCRQQFDIRILTPGFIPIVHCGLEGEHIVGEHQEEVKPQLAGNTCI